MSGTVGSKIVKGGLVFYVDAANPKSYVSGDTTCTDLVGGNVGSLQNGTGFSTENNGGWSFDGSDDYINFVGGIFRPAIQDFTMEVWVKRTSTDGIVVIIPQSSFGLSGEYWINMSSSEISIGIRGLGGAGGTSGSILSNNNWYHIVSTVTHSPKSSKIYIDGELINDDTTWDTMVDNSNAPIGIGANFPNTAFGGQISNVKIYNKVLTQEVITRNYNTLKGRFGL